MKIKMTESKFSRLKKGSSAYSGGAKQNDNVKYTVISNEFVDWKPNNFIEISHKTYDAGGDGQKGEFYALSRGYYATGSGDMEKGTPIYQKSLTIPATEEVLNKFISELDRIMS